MTEIFCDEVEVGLRRVLSILKTFLGWVVGFMDIYLYMYNIFIDRIPHIYYTHKCIYIFTYHFTYLHKYIIYTQTLLLVRKLELFWYKSLG